MSHLTTSTDFFPRLNPGDVSLLSGRGWLATRPPDFCRALLARAVPRSYVAGEAVYRHGDPADGLHGVCEGTVRISIPADNGQEFEAHRDSAGFWIGDLAQLSGETRLVSVFATTPLRMLYISTQRMNDMVLKNPAFIQHFYALSYENTRTTLRLLANMAVAQTDSRLCLRLLHLDETLADGEGWMAVSQGNLAAMIAVSMPTLQRALRRLTDAGTVELGYGRLRLLDRAALLAHGQD